MPTGGVSRPSAPVPALVGGLTMGAGTPETGDIMETRERPDLSTIISNIEKQHGTGAIRALDADPLPVPVIATGLPALDDALGIGGWPLGCVVEVYGPDPDILRTLALTGIVSAQLAGRTVALVDVEHRFAVERLPAGIDPAHILVSQPDDGEQALDIVEALARSAAMDLIIIDSVPGLLPRETLDSDDARAGLAARMMSRAMRKLVTCAARSATCILFLNRAQRVEGVTFGPCETTAGGNALKYYASVRVDLRPEPGDNDDPSLGGKRRVRARVVKNKFAPPFRAADLLL